MVAGRNKTMWKVAAENDSSLSENWSALPMNHRDLLKGVLPEVSTYFFKRYGTQIDALRALLHLRFRWKRKQHIVHCFFAATLVTSVREEADEQRECTQKCELSYELSYSGTKYAISPAIFSVSWLLEYIDEIFLMPGAMASFSKVRAHLTMANWKSPSTTNWPST